LRAISVLAILYQIANAKSESAHLRKNMVAVQPFLRALGDPRGTLGSFSFAISLWNDKEMAFLLSPSARSWARL
jgi:hypothetical protein